MIDDIKQCELQPRAFARTVGYLMQVTGGVMLILSTCACCSFAFVEGGKWHSLGTQFREPDNQGLTIMLVTAAVGAFCLVAFGLGMQSDRGIIPALGSSLTSVVMSILFAGAIRKIYLASQPGYFLVLCILLLLLTLVTSLFCISALIQIIKDPPLPGYTVAVDDIDVGDLDIIDNSEDEDEEEENKHPYT